jgi:prepilin-type N-terminal cleavage/methylation domain-containing protein
MGSRKGYSLAELVIAVAMIGVMSAFTIPKIVNSQDTELTRAKLRQTAVALEQGFFDMKMQGKLVYGQTLFNSMIVSLNHTMRGSSTTGNAAIDAGGPFVGEGINHPCFKDVAVLDANADVTKGWILLPNGAVVTGLYRTIPDAFLDNKRWNSANHDAFDNHVLCIDVNGSQKPNQLGVDVFVGNFNMWGAYNGTPKANSRAFNWGGPAGPLYDTNGTMLGGIGGIGDPNHLPRVQVGYFLAD